MKEIVTFALEKNEVAAIDEIATRDKDDIRSRSVILRKATREFIFRNRFNKPASTNKRIGAKSKKI